MKASHVALASRWNWRTMRHLALALVAGALAVGAAAQTDDHGDRASATDVELPSETAGEIDPGDDEDWFRFRVAAKGAVTAESTGDLDTVGTLYNANGNELATSHDDSGTNFRISYTLVKGTYYVRVRSFGSGTGSYILRLQGGDDHGDDRASATPVELPSETAGAIGSGPNADWFRFEVTASGEVTAETAGHLDTIGTLHDADGNVLENDDDSGNAYNFRIQRQLDAGTYYVRVESFGNGTGSYTLRLGFEASDDGGPAPSATPWDPHRRNLGDFNDDGKDDVLLRHEDGRWRYYPMDGRDVLAGSGLASLTRDWAWQIAGVGDFDGDGKDDVLLRKTEGRWYFYPMDGRTVLPGRGTVRLTWDLAWEVAGIGDFDGDGKDDVLLRHEDGRWHYYRMSGRRPLAGSGGVGLTTDLAWHVAGIRDFDGDGRADVLLRHEDGRWRYYPMDGRTALSGAGMASLTTNLAWRVAGIGDFNGDGRADVLLRHEDGRWRYYPMDGRAVRSGSGAVNLADDTTAIVAGIGDMDGDGRADVLTRRIDGSWYYYAMDGRRVLSATGEAALTGNLAWGALPGGAATGGPTTDTPLSDQSLTLRRDEAIDLSEAFVDDQMLMYEIRSSDPDVVRASVTADVLTLTPVAEGTATVTVTARDPDGNSATQTFTVTVAESDGDTFRDCAECPLMARIPAGTFTMGAPESEFGSRTNERPQRTVSIPAFAAGVHEVTFAQWDTCVAAGGCGGHIPRDDWGRDERPVIFMSWNHAQLYVDWLSQSTGRRYRLLTESEWEYAARAGTATPFHTGGTITPQQANFNGQWDYPGGDYNESGLYRGHTVPVGSFAPNGFGLYDMHGNVWEWVQDCYGSYAAAPNDGSAAEQKGCSFRVLRGGSWNLDPWGLRSAMRHRDSTGNRYASFGFRVARTL